MLTCISFSEAAGVFETDITRANKLITDWTAIARDVARHCKYRERGECLMNCRGLAVCQLDSPRFVQEGPCKTP